jgi:LysM domain
MKSLFSILAVAVLCCASVVSAEEPALDAGKSYIVKRGDTLSEICFMYMENGARSVWRREGSRLLLENPHLIYPGQVFRFPFVYRIVEYSDTTPSTPIATSFRVKWSLDKEYMVYRAWLASYGSIDSWAELEAK